MTRLLLLTVLATTLSVASVVSARMYEWVNPATGSVQLTGTPPSWYRSEGAGPRVRVFDAGRLVDDTAIEVDTAESKALRELAMREFQQRAQVLALKRLEEAARRDAMQREAAARVAEQRESDRLTHTRALAASDAGQPEAPAQSQAVAAPEPTALDPATIARLKALIDDWDQNNAAGAGDTATR